MTEPVWQEEPRGSLFPSEFLGMTGIEQLRLFFSGHLEQPPIGQLTGMTITEVGVGSATFTMPVTDWLRAPQGTIATGLVAILADGPLGCAIQTTLPAATGYTTTELSINMVRPVPLSGHLVARGRVVHSSRQLALSEVFITDDAGRLIAHGTSRCAIFPPLPDAPPGPADLPPPPDPVDDGWVPPYRRSVVGDVLAQDVWDTRSGLEVMEAFVAGELPWPPTSYLFGQLPTEVAEGSCTFTMPAHGWLASPLGFGQGGTTAYLADAALASAVQTTTPAGTAIAPTDLRVQYLRPVICDGSPLTATGEVVHRGRNFAAVRGEVTNGEGKAVALASAGVLIQPGRPADLREGLSPDTV